MVVKIGILGSCVSRDIFYSKINNNYKNFFKIEVSAIRTSIISIMQNPINIDDNLLKISPNNKPNKDRSSFIKSDLNKSICVDLLNKELDFLIIDNYFEIIMGILYFDNNIITNNHWDLPDTEFYKSLENKRTLRMIENPKEYFKIWAEHFDLFFNFMERECPNTKIIINKARLVDKVKKNNGKLYKELDYTNQMNIINPLLDKLDSHICENYNVLSINMDFNNICVDENHLWGKAPVHYEQAYYKKITYCLIKLIEEYNNSVSSISDEYWKNEYNQLFNKNEEFKEKNNKLSDNNKKLKKQLKKEKKKNKTLLNSNSWKITKPLRRIKNLFK